MDNEIQIYLAELGLDPDAPDPMQSEQALDALLWDITYARVKQRLTQKQLAELVGTTQPAIARIERGRGNPSLRQVAKICAALNIKLTVQ